MAYILIKTEYYGYLVSTEDVILEGDYFMDMERESYGYKAFKSIGSTENFVFSKCGINFPSVASCMKIIASNDGALDALPSIIYGPWVDNYPSGKGKWLVDIVEGYPIIDYIKRLFGFGKNIKIQRSLHPNNSLVIRRVLTGYKI